MKRKMVSSLLALCMMMLLLPVTAFAQAQTVDSQEALKNAVAAGGEITLGTDIVLTEGLEIPEGKTVTLNLNGHTLSYSAADTISNKGTLTVAGAGSVVNTGNGGALVNYPGAVANLTGGTFQGNKWYTLKNLGTMTISGEAVVTTADTEGKSSLIANGWYGNGTANDRKVPYPADGTPASLIIEKGTFTGGMNTVKNDDYGKLEISGGSFSNTNGPAVMNWNEASISGGEFTAPNGAVLSNGYLDGTADKGVMTVTGGTFTSGNGGTDPLFGYNEGAGKGGSVSLSNVTVNAVVSTYENVYDVSVSSGTFSSAVPAACIAGDKTAASLTSGGTTAYYIGTNDEVAAKLSGAGEGDSVTVQQGTLTLSNVAPGVVVKNEGTGTVEVNGTAVSPDEEMTTVHVHHANKVEAKEPTAEAAGNIEYWYCAECGKYFSDEALTKEISKEATVIPAKESDEKEPEDGSSPSTGETGSSMVLGLVMVLALAGAAVSYGALRRSKKASHAKQ